MAAMHGNSDVLQLLLEVVAWRVHCWWHDVRDAHAHMAADCSDAGHTQRTAQNAAAGGCVWVLIGRLEHGLAGRVNG